MSSSKEEAHSPELGASSSKDPPPLRLLESRSDPSDDELPRRNRNLTNASAINGSQFYSL